MATKEAVTLSFDAGDDPQLVREWFEAMFSAVFTLEVNA